MAKDKAKDKKKPTGRPTRCTEATGLEICKRLAEGESLNEICRDDKMPKRATVFGWLLSDDPKYKAFSDLYAQARKIQFEGMADELLDIADDGTNDWQERYAQDGGVIEVPNHEHIQRSRVRIDTRKFILAKAMPKRYGKRAEEAGGGHDENKPLPWDSDDEDEAPATEEDE